MRTRLLALAVALLAAGCTTTPQPPPKSKPEPEKTIVKPAEVLPAPTADLKGELMVTMAFGSLDALLGAVSGYVAPQVPSAFQPMVQPAALRDQLFKTLRIQDVASALDTTRPFALAIADPMVHRSGLGPLVVAVPIKDGGAIVEFLGRHADKHESTAWKDHIYTTGSGQLILRVEKEWAYLASSDKLVNGAKSALAPLCARARGAGGELVLETGIIYGRYGKQIDQGIDRLGDRSISTKMPGLLRMLQRWLGYAKGTERVVLQAQLGAGEIKAQLALTPRSGGELRRYLSQLEAGGPWGAKFIPADAFFTLLSRSSADERQRSVDDALATLKGVGDAVPEAALTKLREGMLAAMKPLGSESAIGLWIDANGGLGGGGAVAVKDAAALQKQLRAVMTQLGKELAPTLSKLLGKQLKDGSLAGFGVGLAVKAGGLKAGGVSADLFEVALKWPKPKDKDARKKVEEAKKAVAKLFGPKLLIAFGVSGDLGLVAFGKDHKKRLGELAAIAKGGAGSAMEKTLAGVAGGRQVVTLFHLPVATAIESALRVADQLTKVPTEVREAVTKILPGAGKNAPVSGVLYRDGERLTWDVTVSPDVIGVLVKTGMYMFMTRMAAPPPPATP